MHLALSVLCYVLAALAFVRVLLLAEPLGAERLAEPTRREFWTTWIPGRYTPRGQQLRRHMAVMAVLGLLFLVAGVAL